MGIALMFLLALYQMQSAIHSEIIETPNLGDNALGDAHGEEPNNSNEPHPVESELLDALLDDNPEQTELEFRYPISAIGIDYAKNSVVLRFQKHARKQRYKYDPDYEMKRTSLKDNFMHFGKRQAEQLPQAMGNNYYDAVKRSGMDRYGRDPKQDFMRFGRAPSDFLRFGRSPSDYMRFGRNPKEDFMRFGRNPKEDFMRFGRDPKADFMRFGRDPKADFMRFGRSPKEDFMRFGRDPKEDFMRFGRDPKEDFMRFGRDPKENFMRFGRTPQEDFMRFGRSPQEDFMRFGRTPKDDSMPMGRTNNHMRFGRNSNFQEELLSPKQDFMRFGRPDNFMRFGRSTGTETEAKSDQGAEKGLTTSESKQTKTAEGKPSEESNPTDKAITMLFSKHQKQDQEQQQPQEEPQQKSSEQTDPQVNLEDSSVEQLFEP